MMLTEYETTVILRPDISGDVVESTLDRVREAVNGRGGKLLAINHWGKKRLAYEIEKQPRGIYVHTQYLGPNDLVAELERTLRISDNVLRFMTIQVAKDVNPTEREVTEYVAPSYDAQVDEDEGLELASHDDEGSEEYHADNEEGSDSESRDEPSGDQE